MDSSFIVRLLAAASLVGAAACHVAPIPPSTTPMPTSPSRAASPIAAAEQIVVVTTPQWDSTGGTLRRFERRSPADAWQPVGEPTAIVTGRTGLAWGVGFDAVSADPAAPHKHEGDGRSPAGVFPLDTLFGYANDLDPAGLHLPYVALTGATDCVDDPASLHYNTVVSREAVPRIDWTSAEHMRSVGQYRIGVIVGYNATPPVPGRGSCIFLHIWAGPSSTTAGCTALDAAALAAIVRWLDRARHPMLVQLPADEYARLRDRWSLPPI